MNNDIVNNETGLLCYRLRTARQRKRAAYKEYEKKLRALDRERHELWQKQRSLGWVELKPPVMRGWKRYFVLRDDVAKSKQATFFQGILDKINTVAYSSRKDFKIKCRSNGKKLYQVQSQRLRYLSEVSLKKHIFTQQELGFFEERLVPAYWGKFQREWVFTEPWRFVLRTRANLITKTRIRDEELESRLAKIEKIIERENLDGKIARLRGHSKRYWKDYEDLRNINPFKNVPVSQILDTIKKEERVYRAILKCFK